MVVFYQPPAEMPSTIEPEPIDLSILYEDEYLLAVDKPADLVVHPGVGNRTGTLLAGVLHYLGQLPATDPVRPGVVHRLDRGTTGVIVFAKTRETHTLMVEKFKNREISKSYLAITQGVPKPANGTYDTMYGRHPHHRQQFSSKVVNGKQAITHYETLEAYPGAASIQVTLETGRTHQIRVHFADAGFPLVGDSTYAKRRVIRDPLTLEVCQPFLRPALHAWMLELEHPITGEELTVTAPMAPDLVELVEKLRGVQETRHGVSYGKKH